MPLFDAYMFVDWSAKHGLLSPRPAADGIWLGESTPGANVLPITTYYRSRHGCISAVLARLLNHLKNRRRVLVGFDFPYGYPAGWCQALGLKVGSQAAWLTVWAELARRIKDNANNENNRFTVAHDFNKLAGQGESGPLWGCPAAQATPYLQPRSPGFPFLAAKHVKLARLRIVETRLRGVQEAWKLFGAGSVGSQALVGIPWLYLILLT